MRTPNLDEMLAINERQKAYYETSNGWGVTAQNNGPTNLWRWAKTRALAAIDSTTSEADVIALHREWAGDLSGKRVLDIGCGWGNTLTVEFARAAKEYVAVELSSTRCAELRERLTDAPRARVINGDVLNPSLDLGQFDLIYALGVFHHFKHFEAFLTVAKSLLAPNGSIIIFDPVQTWLPIRLVRAALRPFQSDADWEYPFTEQSLTLIETHFRIADCRGLLGLSKWAALAGLFNSRFGARLAQKWHAADWQKNRDWSSVRSCLRVTARLTHEKVR